MKKVQHFILTRFNLRLVELSTDLDSDKFGNKIDRDQWLLHRFELFERYCLPSMAAQANQDFRWFLFFDEATPSQFRERIELARDSCPQIQAFYIKGTHIHDYVLEQVDTDIGCPTTGLLRDLRTAPINALEHVRPPPPQA